MRKPQHNQQLEVKYPYFAKALEIGTTVLLGGIVFKQYSPIAGLTVGLLVYIAFELWKDKHVTKAQYVELMEGIRRVNTSTNQLNTDLTLTQLRSHADQSPPLVANVIRDKLSRFERFSQVAMNGLVEISKNEVPQYAFEAAKSLNKSLWATSYLDLDDFLLAPCGEDYVDKIIEIVQRNPNLCLKVKRILIIKDLNILRRKDVLRFILRHLEVGIQIRIVLESKLPEDLRRDFAIWNGSVVFELVHNEDRTLQKARLKTGKEECSEHKQVYKNMWLEAEPAEKVLSKLHESNKQWKRKSSILSRVASWML